MIDYKIFKFEELIKEHKILLSDSVLILGNGASIAVCEKFSYDNLFKKACEERILSDKTEDLFRTLQTNDFELILNKLRQAAVVNEILKIESQTILAIYDDTRNGLIEVIKEIHVPYKFLYYFGLNKLNNIQHFIEKFKNVINLNYDLIVYWAIMLSNQEVRNQVKDCFTQPVEGGDLGFNYEIDKMREPFAKVSNPTLIFYPHGSLILATNKNNDEVKIKSRKDNYLLEEIEEKWKEEYIPLFVSEGDSIQKLKAIRRSAYLNFVYENVLGNIGSVAVVYGWRMGKQEEHLINKIFHQQGIKKVLISVYCGKTDAFIECRPEQERIVALLKAKRTDIDIFFFEATSENCWCN